MGQLLLLLVVALTVAAVVFGVTVLVTGADPGLEAVEPDSGAVLLPPGRSFDESDLKNVRFDTALRGYRMDQVDEVMRRATYDNGYKAELIDVLELEVEALRDGRLEAADHWRQARRLAIEAAGRGFLSEASEVAAARATTSAPEPGTARETGAVPESGAAEEPGTVPEPGTAPEGSTGSAAGVPTSESETAGQPAGSVRSERA